MSGWDGYHNLGPLPSVTREGNEIHAGEWSWDLRDEAPTLDDARAVLAAALWFQEHTR